MKFQSNTVTSLILVFLLLGSFSCGSKGDGGKLIDLLPPLTVVAKATGQQIDLTWLDQTNGEEGFVVERKIGVGEFQALGTPLAANSQSYADTGLAASTQYTYRLRAFKGSEFSGYSNEATATTSATGLMLAKIRIDYHDGMKIHINDGKLQAETLNTICIKNSTVSLSQLNFNMNEAHWASVYSPSTWSLFPEGTVCSSGDLSNEFDLQLNGIIPGGFNGVVMIKNYPNAVYGFPEDLNSFTIDLYPADPDYIEIIYAYTADISKIPDYKNLGIGYANLWLQVPVETLAWEICSETEYNLYLLDGQFFFKYIDGLKSPTYDWTVDAKYFTQSGWEDLYDPAAKIWKPVWTTDPVYDQVTYKFDIGFPDIKANEFARIVEMKRYERSSSWTFVNPNSASIVFPDCPYTMSRFLMLYVYTKN